MTEKKQPKTRRAIFPSWYKLPLIMKARVVFSGLTILAIIFLFISIAIYMKRNDSIGIMGMISIVIISFGIVISIFMWLMSLNKNKDSQIFENLKSFVKKPCIYKFSEIISLQIILAIGIIFFFFHLHLFGRAYISITPSIFLIFAFAITWNRLLYKNNVPAESIKQFFHNLSVQDGFFIALSIVGFGLIERFLSTQLFLQVSKGIGNNASNWFFISLYKSIFIFIYINFIYLLLRILPFKRKWLQGLNGENHPGFLLPTKKPTIKFFQKHPEFLSLIITVVFFFVFLIFITPGYDANDDITMITIMSGYLTSHPIEYPVHSNVIIGKLFSSLFLICNDVNWVVLFYILVNFFSTWTLVLCILKMKSNRTLKVIFLTFLLLFVSYFLTSITFTTVAAVSSLAGICLILSCLREYSKKCFPLILIGILHILIGGLIRLQSIFLVIAVFTPFLLVNVTKFFTIKALGTFFATLAILIGFYLYNSFYVHSNPEWSEYYQYNQARTQLQDRTGIYNITDNSIVLDSVTWSSNDLYLFEHTIYLDKHIYSSQNYQTLIDQISKWQQPIDITYQKVIKAFSVNPTKDFLKLSLVAWFILILSTNNKGSLYSSLTYVCTLLFIIFVLAWGFKIPNRVIIPLLMSITILFFVTLEWYHTDNPNRNLTYSSLFAIKAFSLLLLITLSTTIWSVISRPYQQSKSNNSNQLLYSQIQNDLSELVTNGSVSKNALLLSSGIGYPFVYMDIYHLDFPPIKTLTLGWNSFSPYYNTVLNQYGFTQISDALIENDQIYLIVKVREIPSIKLFYKEHYGKTIDAQIIYIIGKPDLTNVKDGDIAIYKFTNK